MSLYIDHSVKICLYVLLLIQDEQEAVDAKKC